MYRNVVTEMYHDRNGLDRNGSDRKVLFSFLPIVSNILTKMT